MTHSSATKKRSLLHLSLMALGICLSLCLLALAELGTYLLFISPPSGAAFLAAARTFYREQDRNLVHYMPECSRYNSRTTYRLKPGSCRFATREFDTTISANALGFRSSAEDLDSPEVIVLGDSQSFGWGVNDAETYPAILKQTLGLKVLNGSMPSYATVRELRVLDEVETSKTKVLVLQYCENDRHENATFAQNDGVLPIASEQVYTERVAETVTRQNQGYYPGKYLHRYLPMLYGTLRASSPELLDLKKARILAAHDAGLFLRALQGAAKSLGGLEIVVLHLSSYNEYSLPFIPALQRRWAAMQKAKRMPDLKLHFVRADQILDDDDFYRLDDHMRPQGHRKVAKLLAEVIKTKL
ncbi:MAG: hypothetical protein K1X83_14430 [Oligoflexia bacterium]|nr:hypothetical protein [Oligoflexia bacterium]